MSKTTKTTTKIKWEDKIPTIRTMREKGETWEAIALKIGVSKWTMWRHASNLGLSPALRLPILRDNLGRSAQGIMHRNVKT